MKRGLNVFLSFSLAVVFSLSFVSAGFFEIFTGKAIDGYCGDGILGDGESCDWGTSNGMKCIPATGDSCTYCSVECSLATVIDDGTTSICGNGVLESGESCDDGDYNGNCPSKCSKSCKVNVCSVLPVLCGNGKIDVGEECDDGNSIGNDGCTNDCQLNSLLSCDDSDGGKEYYLPGGTTVVNSSGAFIGIDICHKDWSEKLDRENTLFEFYCDENGNLAKEEYDCPEGCYTNLNLLGRYSYGGYCISGMNLTMANESMSVKIFAPETVQLASVFEVSWSSVGTEFCSAYGSDTPLIKGDSWINLSNLPSSGNETLRVPGPGDSNYLSPSLFLGIQCWNSVGQDVIAGATILVAIDGEQSCFDSDDGDKGNVSGEVTDRYGVWKDFCGFNGKGFSAYEASCKEGFASFESIECTRGCIDGACSDLKSCLEFDKGMDYQNFGITTAYLPGEGVSNREDYCYDEKTLIENFCGTGEDDLPSDSVIYECPFGCAYGACISSCSDSDGGANLFVKGRLTTDNPSWMGGVTTDFCLIGKEGLGGFSNESCEGSDCYVVEYFCSNLGPVDGIFHCPSGCQNGACLESYALKIVNTIKELFGQTPESPININEINITNNTSTIFTVPGEDIPGMNPSVPEVVITSPSESLLDEVAVFAS